MTLKQALYEDIEEKVKKEGIKIDPEISRQILTKLENIEKKVEEVHRVISPEEIEKEEFRQVCRQAVAGNPDALKEYLKKGGRVPTEGGRK